MAEPAGVLDAGPAVAGPIDVFAQHGVEPSGTTVPAAGEASEQAPDRSALAAPELGGSLTLEDASAPTGAADGARPQEPSEYEPN